LAFSLFYTPQSLTPDDYLTRFQLSESHMEPPMAQPLTRRVEPPPVTVPLKFIQLPTLGCFMEPFQALPFLGRQWNILKPASLPFTTLALILPPPQLVTLAIDPLGRFHIPAAPAKAALVVKATTTVEIAIVERMDLIFILLFPLFLANHDF